MDSEATDELYDLLIPLASESRTGALKANVMAQGVGK
jgi:hypothetical protein